MVFHDETLKRIAGVPTRISDLRYEELRKVNLGSWFNKRFPSRASEDLLSETIPTLEEVLSILENYKGKVYLEIKSDRKTDNSLFIEKIGEAIEKYRFSLQIVLKSFELQIIKNIRRFIKEVRTSALFAPRVRLSNSSRKEILELADEAEVDEISIHFLLATKSLVANAKRRGFGVAVWTVNHPVWLRRAMKTGIDAIITDNPSKFWVV